MVTYDADYLSLTEHEKSIICNGCGGKGEWINPPQLRSREFCDYHDWLYFIGCTEADREIADNWLHDAIQEDAGSRPWWQRPGYRLEAWIFYRAVRFFGSKYFRYGTTKLKMSELRTAQTI